MMDIITGRAPPPARAESYRSKGCRTIENLEDYIASVALTAPFAETEGVSAIRQLTEGAQPQISPLQDTLLYGANADLTGTAAGTPQRASFTRKTPKIQMRLQTGLFQADQIV